MTEEVRAAINARLREKGMTRADLARATGKTPQTVTRALNASGRGAGSVPEVWAAMLDALDLELTTRPRTPGAEAGAEKEGGSTGR